MANISDEYPRLYHYTNEQGLYGILENRCLWATHYKFLNDDSEIEIFREKFKLLLPDILVFYTELLSKSTKTHELLSDQSALYALAKGHIKGWVDSYYDVIKEIYILSFCGEHPDDYINQNGLLSQWRGYGGDGGFSIVFNTHSLEELLQSECKAFRYDYLHFSNVIYSDDEDQFQSELSEPLRKFKAFLTDIKMHMRMLDGKQKPADDACEAEAYGSFIQCITRFKHQGFKEEQEVRMVATLVPFNKIAPEIIDKISQGATGYENYQSKPEKERKFRIKNGRQTPYIELFRSLDKPLPIEKIIVGPHKDKEARAAALRVYLRNTDIEVAVSEIPYIG